MKLTVLVDNNTLIDRYFSAEPGVSYYLEADGLKVLFDTGYSDVFIDNACRMGIDLLDLDCVVLSHGHLDHTWGLAQLMRIYTEAALEGRGTRRPRLVAHPHALLPKKNDDLPQSGILFDKDTLASFFRLELSEVPYTISTNMVFLGQIERANDFEAQEPYGKVLIDGQEEDDYLLDDTALACMTPVGLVVVSGCSHSGICNIVEYARKVTGWRAVMDIIGGFHLMNPAEERLQGTVNYMKGLNLPALHACHCTDLKSKIALSEAADIIEVGVGLTLEF